MLQVKELPTPDILRRFAQRYPDADTSAVSTLLVLLRAATELSQALDTFLLRHGLLQGRWWVLILLFREESLQSSPSELAGKAGVTRATMTGLLDGLERDGLVQRSFEAADRRRVTVRLTDAGQAALDQVMPDYYRRVRALMVELDEPQREQLQTLLGVLRKGTQAFA
ncbi:MarR family winged helix-turn-helix transcriptional regulator [Methyloversatilis thermotolerans]|uniref:MarR family winged helix-turn-helix transcriptional regulator n=1 Tax=Methyloversatilis thermotolerans TaxID=1346290 RepID=UPI0003728F50|nr:MarR family transcriptional regulator [Methyloversatilis thermotolerans]